MSREIISRSAYEEREHRREMERAAAPPRPGKRLPRCPPHLNPAAAVEWRRIARALLDAGVLTTFDRAALAAYCQAWGRWVEAEERLRETPPLVKTPSGYVQQSPWLLIANKQLELMGRYMVELGLTPAARSRVNSGMGLPGVGPEPLRITRVIVDHDVIRARRLAEAQDASARPRLGDGAGDAGRVWPGDGNPL